MQHAVEHATSDLAGSVKIPGFRPGKVPMQVLRARLGEERLLTEAVESHIGGWFWNAAASSRIQPIAQPPYEYDLPASDDDAWSFTATVDVQPKPELADWTTLEVPYVAAEIPPELVDQEIEVLRESVADLAPVEGRAAQTGDVVVVDAVEEGGEAQRDLVLELGAGRLLEDVERALIGASPGDTRAVEYSLPDDSSRTTQVTVKEIKEKVLPPADDDFARAASEFDTYAELRDEIEELTRGRAEAAGEDADDVVPQPREAGRFETLRADLRLKETLDRIVSEVKRISPDLAQARDKLWPPDKETASTETKLWTPASKEPA